ncbi:MAG: hypothetical protein KAW61_02400 [candidate division Zixibacteria bacterium]|nr:hypothetical protein [candidate division Zixibacteria bacterium]
MLALICIAGTIALIVGEHVTAGKAEREHKADLLYIQKLGSELRHLGFEVALRDIDTSGAPEQTLGVVFDMITKATTTGFLSTWVSVGFSPDSGWYMRHSENSRWNSVTIQVDTLANHLRFMLKEFCLTWKDRIFWQPDDIADFSRVNISLTVSPFPFGDSQGRYYMIKGGRRVNAYHVFGRDYCPVSSISIYANDFDIKNRLLVAEYLPKYREWGGEMFAPMEVPGRGVDTRDFSFDPLWMRQNILESLK